MRRERRRMCPRLHALEVRSLLSGLFQDFTVPPFTPQETQIQIAGLGATADGKLAFDADYLAPVVGSPHPLVHDDGVGISTLTSDGTFTAIRPAPTNDSSLEGALATGGDGHLYGIGLTVSRVEADGSLTKIAVPGRLGGIAEGFDGAIWVTTNLDDGSRGIARVAADGTYKLFTPLAPNGMTLGPIVAGPDQAMWFVEQGTLYQAGAIGRISASGQVTEYPLPDYRTTPVSIALGPDGDLWFTEAGYDDNRVGANGNGFGINRIGQITPSGVLTEHDLPPIASTLSGISSLGQIVSGPQGALWFAEPGADALGRITTDGAYAAFPVPSSVAASPLSLVATPDGSLWFNSADQIGVHASNSTEVLGSDQIGRFVPGSGLSAAAPAVVAPPGLTYSGPVATFSAAVPVAASSYAATIDWGDGSPIASATVSASGTGFVVDASHTYAQAGTYATRVVIRDISVQGDATSAAGSVAVSTPVPVTPTPTITSAQLVTLRNGSLRLVLTYSGPIDATSASDASRYLLTEPGPNGRFGTKKDTTIRVKTAVYDASSHTVTLTPRRPLARTRPVRVAISGGPTITVARPRAGKK